MRNAELLCLLSACAFGLIVSCTAPADDDEVFTPPQDGGTDVAAEFDHGDGDFGADEDPFVFQIGSGVPLTPWRDGGELPVVAGFQGGHHTEHEVQLRGIERDALKASRISVAVHQGDEELASGGWLFGVHLFDEVAAGWQASVPPVVFQSSPPIGEEVELSANVELADGRQRDILLRMTLVDL